MEGCNLHNEDLIEPKSDIDLWDDLRAGRKSALRQLFLKYHDDLYRYGLAFCSHEPGVEDSIQNLFYELWEKHADLSRVDNIKAYLWVSFRRALLKKLKDLNKTTALFECKLQQFGMAQSRETVIIKDERISINKKLLEEALATLSDKEHEALYLKYYEGMSYEEIQMIMDVSYQTARNYIYRAISNLRETIEKDKFQANIPLQSIVFLLLLLL